MLSSSSGDRSTSATPKASRIGEREGERFRHGADHSVAFGECGVRQ